MMAAAENGDFFLNRENRWLDFHWQGLQLGSDGTLRLDFVPAREGDLPPELASLPVPSGPAGIVVGPDSSVYLSDPKGHRLLRVDGCDRTLAPVPCLGGQGGQATQFQEPRGLLYHPVRRALLVADSGNHRIQLFDHHSFQLLDIWGNGHGSETVLFDTPSALAADHQGNVYVVDHGNPRVQKLDLSGNVSAEFAKNIHQHSAVTMKPCAIAVHSMGKDCEVLILDGGSETVLIFDGNGRYLRSIGQNVLQQPMGLAADEDGLYVGHNGWRRILRFKFDGTLVGAAIGFEGPVAALALDAKGRLLVHTGSAEAPVQLMIRGGFCAKGFMWGGPFRNPSVRLEQWNWLRARVETRSAEAPIQFFLYSAAADHALAADLPDSVAPWDGNSIDFSACLPGQPDGRQRAGTWVRLPLGITECLIPGIASEDLWIGAEFHSEGLTSPILSQIRLEFDHQTYLPLLPTIYREQFLSRQFLARFLSLFESLFSEVGSEISELPLLFDPASAPAEFLSWLGRWLAMEVPEGGEESRKRQGISEAFETFAHTGTPKGLRLAVQRATGIAVRIEEPILNSSWWSLPTDETSLPLNGQDSILGFTTMLAPAAAQGAVLGTTAVLDRSHLLTEEEFGVPLFQDVAAQFLIEVYRGDVETPAQRDQLLAVVDREKPAHTAYQLCIIEPRMRIGFQARVGIDAVLAGPAPSTSLGEPFVSGTNLILGGLLPGRVGERSILGQTTRLGESSVEAPALRAEDKHRDY